MLTKDSKMVPFICGGFAGLSVDLAMYPIDTVKTRMQSKKGFLRAGGMAGVYAGLSAVTAGSIPGAALFFVTYEVTQRRLSESPLAKPQCHLIAASFGEIMASLVRVPTEVVKQRAQVMEETPSRVIGKTIEKEGFKGLYRGYFITVSRDLPFCAIQFPLWEFLKSQWSQRQSDGQIGARESSICGAIAAATAAVLTTPLDVAKTWIMLAKTNDPVAKGNILMALVSIFKNSGVRGLFKGVVPRMLHISLGGAIFLGIYDFAKINLLKYEVY